MNYKMTQAIIVAVLLILICLLITSCKDRVRIYGAPFKRTYVRNCYTPSVCCKMGNNINRPGAPYEYFCGYHNDCDGQETVETEITPYQWRYADENTISGDGKEEVVLRVIDRCH